MSLVPSRPLRVRAALVLVCGAFFATVTGCRTGSFGDDAASVSAVPAEPAGYFVSIAANSVSSDVVAIYDEIHYALDRQGRKEALAAGTLDTYISEYDAEGYTSLIVGEHEIECDRDKCLVKLPQGRIVTGDADSFAGHLTTAFSASRLKPQQREDQGALTRTWIVGKKPDMFLSCVQTGTGKKATFACEFDLERGLAVPVTEVTGEGSVPRGKLVSCDQSPGTTRSAEDARAEIEGSNLLNLTQGPKVESKPVGYLRYVQTPGGVEFEDLYLCGDVSHDFFMVGGTARSPRAWLPAKVKKGASLSGLTELTQDEAVMQASATVVEDSAEQVTMQVRFKIAGAGGAAAAVETYGDDGFFVRIDKRWLK